MKEWTAVERIETATALSINLGAKLARARISLTEQEVLYQMSRMIEMVLTYPASFLNTNSDQIEKAARL